MDPNDPVVIHEDEAYLAALAAFMALPLTEIDELDSEDGYGQGTGDADVTE